MARFERGALADDGDYWPGFVDAMATLLIVIIFLLSAFVVGHFALTQEISGKDSVLNRLQQEISDLTDLLALERSGRDSLETELGLLNASLVALEAERDAIRGDYDAILSNRGSESSVISDLRSNLDEERNLSRRALSQVEILNQQLAALRRQIASLEDALDASEAKDRESRAKIADLGRRLNVALARKVQELNRYRSDFFGRLREILAERSDILVVGDRFVFPSSLLFDSGSAEITAEGGTEQLDQLARAVIELQGTIPSDINWVLRVDGHTDARPIRSSDFPSNWELSSARAISVVRYLTDQGVDPRRLVAAGFGEFQPLSSGDDEEALSRNRRIELKLTEP